ncbi:MULTISPECIES: hypothetical protein [unclassified Streptomyces]|uniref:hypothetical protein n=1 Tax=unclassified Streptomyces TaxID=2593676 RepID=UPI0009389EDA|nr:hypothetical protein [Streptomyces sp. TSRI0281]OKI48635.1 hypothetical protein A6A29_00165 [Streptomyces sp. TSRI0281]
MPTLYLRSRAFPATAVAVAGLALLAAWASHGLGHGPGFDSAARVAVTVFAPLFASAAIGTSLFSHSDELDRTAARRWWPRRLGHLLALTVLAAGALALAVPEQFGAAATVRNVLGATGVTVAAAALSGAGTSWLPMTLYGSAVYLAAPRAPGGAAAFWAWPMQPGGQAAAWAMALSAYVAGVALFILRGPRPERP